MSGSFAAIVLQGMQMVQTPQQLIDTVMFILRHPLFGVALLAAFVYVVYVFVHDWLRIRSFNDLIDRTINFPFAVATFVIDLELDLVVKTIVKLISRLIETTKKIWSATHFLRKIRLPKLF